MPYIDEELALELDEGLREPDTPGDLAYALAAVVGDYLEHKGMRWQTIAEVEGALVGTLYEFQRRVQGPYEQTKLHQGGADPFTTRNGDSRSITLDV
jgi:hypothetical protein